jgi:hypothetical protein
MTRWNVEMKYQTTVEAKDETEAYKLAREELMKRPDEAFGSHCKKVKGK